MTKTIPLSKMRENWKKREGYLLAQEEQRPEFELARAIIEARVKAGLTQEELAERMNTSQSAIARMEGLSSIPSTRTLQKLAIATGTHLRIAFD